MPSPFRFYLISTFAATLALGVLDGCDSSSDDPGDHSGVHWTYEGEEGPAFWGSLSEEWAVCSTGTRQSPIDLSNASSEDLADPVQSYQAVPLTIENNGHTIQVSIAAGSTMTVGGQSYELKQFHFHTPSEHTVNGTAYPAEVHYVHANASGDLAVFGVLLADGGAESVALQRILDHAPHQESEPATIAGQTFDPLSLVPQQRQTFRYSGSLTTPPCSEGVSWFVSTTPIQVSSGQLEALRDIIHTSNRPVQALAGRALLQDNS